MTAQQHAGVPDLQPRGQHHDRDVLRDPAGATQPQRRRRAVILLLLTLLVPGGAQVVAGSRRLGRIALAVALGVWAVLLLALVLMLTLRRLLLTLTAHPFMLGLLTVVCVVLAVGWVLIWIDTMRLIRFHLLEGRWRPGLAVVLAVLMVVTSGGMLFAAHIFDQSRDSLGGIFSSGPPIEAVDGRYNILVLGADAGEGREGVRPDSIHVMSVNASTGESLMISVPRNLQNAQFREGSPLWDVYPDGYSCGDECIINFLYPEVMDEHTDLYPDAEDPGAEAMMDAVSGSVGLDIRGYVMVDMDGFSDFIDAMGGVDIESGGWVPYRGPREDGTWGDVWLSPGEYTLSGEQALAYARSREFSSDYNRIQRQQCIQQAMISQFSPQTVLTKFTDLMQAGEQLVETDLPRNQLGSFLDLAVDAQDHEPQRLVLGAPDFGDASAQFSTYPDFDEVHRRVDELIDAEDGGSGWFDWFGAGAAPQ
ncbi:MAG: LCP family protein, partial [Nesterenkonia sp.]|nr:LCP family protein [Nesterenkonia sp.]